MITNSGNDDAVPKVNKELPEDTLAPAAMPMAPGAILHVCPQVVPLFNVNVIVTESPRYTSCIVSQSHAILRERLPLTGSRCGLYITASDLVALYVREKVSGLDGVPVRLV